MGTDGTFRNLYHADNRQQSPTQGCWLTPEPAGLAAVDPSNPQTWNRYAYVNNNPVSFTDPTGLINPAYVCWYCSGGGSSIFGGLLSFMESQDETSWLGSGSISYYSVQGGHLYSTFFVNGTPYWTSPDDTYHFPIATVLADMGPATGAVGGAGSGADFVQFQLSLGAIIGWTGSVTRDRYGTWYWSWLGGNGGKSLTFVSGSLTWGWDMSARAINGGTPNPLQLASDLTGGSSNVCGGLGGGVCVSPAGSVQVGIVSPQFGVSVSRSSILGAFW